MSKQLQDAYIVAATRTPIGKAPRGMFKNTRPDDLLVHAIRGRWPQVPNLDPALIDDAIVGCSFPEAEQGFNVARMAVLLAGLPNTVGGVTVNRYCASGITALAMAADRIRVGEADVMIAGGVESMSMVPMMGHHPSINMDTFKDENVGLAYGMGLTAEKVASSGRCRAKTRTPSAWNRTAAPSPPSRPACSRTRSRRSRSSPARRTWPPARSSSAAPSDLDEGPRADASWKAWPS
jgi:acetyl-CoA acyltransferase